MFIIDQYAGEDFQGAFVMAYFVEFYMDGVPTYTFRDYRDAFIAYCNL